MNRFDALTNLSVYSDGFFTSIDYDHIPADTIVRSLQGLSRLEHLEYAGAELTDLSFVPALPAIRTINVSDNYITDIASLEKSSSLSYINLAGNPVRDWSPSEAWPNLQINRSYSNGEK